MSRHDLKIHPAGMPCRFKTQRGQAMAETVIVFAVMLLLVLGGIQFALIWHAKVTLNYAAFEAARTGALNHASRRSIEYALGRGLAPLYTFIPAGSSMLDKVGRVKQARNRVMDEINGDDPDTPNDPGETSVCIQRINPTPAAFAAYGIPDPNGVLPYDVIPNDNLIYRESVASGGVPTIQDANLLKIRVTYCYPMIVPLVSRLIQKLMLGADADDPDIPEGWATPSVGDFREQCFQGNPANSGNTPRFPIVAHSTVRMQTPAMNDPTFVPGCD
jgi:hypothetical protein